MKKNKPGAFAKQSLSNSNKSAVARQITFPSKSYGKISKVASKSSANEKREKWEILLKLFENLRLLGKIYLV